MSNCKSPVSVPCTMSGVGYVAFTVSRGVTTGLRKATVTIPKGLAYTGVANLTGQTTAQSSTGNITLVGSDNLADNKITIDVKSTATAIDTIKEFAGLLTINTTD